MFTERQMGILGTYGRTQACQQDSFLQYWGLNSVTTPLVTPPALFSEGLFFFPDGSHELFVQGGFEL
jgi:hypothetical protein